jgi:hypothetical protein
MSEIIRDYSQFEASVVKDMADKFYSQEDSYKYGRILDAIKTRAAVGQYCLRIEIDMTEGIKQKLESLGYTLSQEKLDSSDPNSPIINSSVWKISWETV